MAEIRLREVSPELLKRVSRIQQQTRNKTATGAIEWWINSYDRIQKDTIELYEENTKLKKEIAKYESKTGAMRDLIHDNMKNLKRQLNAQNKLLKQFRQKGKKRKVVAR